MANSKNNKRAKSNAKAKNFNGKKLAQSIGAIVLTAVLFGSGIAVGYGAATDFKYKRDVVQQEQQEEQEEQEAPGENLVVSEDEDDARPLRLSVKKMAAQVGAEDNHTTYEITAELAPANTTDVVDMSIAWASECSENISEYMQLDHADGAFTATLTALKPFSTTINLTAKVRDRNITKTVKLDYLKKLNFVDYAAQGSDPEESVEIKLQSNMYSEGSIYPTEIVVTGEITVPDYIKTYLVSKGFNVKTSTINETISINSESGVAQDFVFVQSATLFNNGNDEKLFNAAFATAADDSDSIIANVTITYYTVVDGEKIAAGTVTDEWWIGFDYSSYLIPATAMEIGSDLVFF